MAYLGRFLTDYPEQWNRNKSLESCQNYCGQDPSSDGYGVSLSLSLSLFPCSDFRLWMLTMFMGSVLDPMLPSSLSSTPVPSVSVVPCGVVHRYVCLTPSL